MAEESQGYREARLSPAHLELIEAGTLRLESAAARILESRLGEPQVEPGQEVVAENNRSVAG